ncbi:hypothetical protein FHR74_002306 [Sphingomonas aerolata]|nr:hypothetical protein [Sphingomonas aerolata]
MCFEPVIGFALYGIAAQDKQPRLVEQHTKITPDRLLALHQRVRFADDRGQLLPGGQAVGRATIDVLRLLTLQSGDTHHEELVEIGSRNREKSKPFEQRMRRIARLLDHAPIEREPGKLTVEKSVVRLSADGIVVVFRLADDMRWTVHRSSGVLR